MALTGKGFFLWKILDCEGGDPAAIANMALQSNYSHVLIKIADGTGNYNIDTGTNIDRVPPLVQALHSRGIQAWGWHYVYGYNPTGEADKAIQRCQQTFVDGYVIDAEGEYKESGKARAAATFMTRLRASLPTLPVALSSYRYPSLHPQLPWREFLNKCDLNMPQVYWLQSHNPADQLIRSVREFQALSPSRPIIPVGAAFTERGWSATPEDVVSFMQTAQSLNLTAANFWEWANCRNNLPAVWTAISNYSWSSGNQDITAQYIEALNSRDVNRILGLYSPAAVHVNANRTIHGLEALRGWYTGLLNQILPNATFKLTGFSGDGTSRHMTWTATSSAGAVNNGSDTISLMNGKIVYHFTQFTVQP